MSKVKKIFIVIACSITVLINAFLIALNNIKSNVCIAVGSPYSVVVFDHSTTGNEIKDEKVLEKFYKQMEKLTNVSVYDKLINRASIEKKIFQDSNDKYAKWSTDLLNKNLVIEIIYNSIQDLIVYDGNNSRVVSYYCISFVVPKTDDFTEIAVYYSLTSNSEGNEKNESYAACTPLTLYGNAKELIKFIDKNV